MMQGAAAAKQFVNEYLAQDMPARLVSYRNHWLTDEDSLPDPLLYLTYEPVALDHWPTIITVAISTADLTRVDYDMSMNPQYRVRYNMRTYIWVRADGSEQCTLMRDNLTTVVRSALLDHASLQVYEGSAPSASAACEVKVDEGTMREEFSDLTLIKGDRVLAGAYVAYDINLTETVTRKTLGEVADFDIDAMTLVQLMEQ